MIDPTSHDPKGSAPDIDGARCVHSITHLATCRACVDVCPDGALVMNDALFGVDEEACSSCGLCLPACPQNAISMGDGIQIHDSEALLSCEKAIEADISIKCVHSQGLEQIARFYQKGVRRLAVATGDCDNCPYGKQARLDDHIATFNQLAESRGLSLIETISVDVARWKKRAAEKVETGIANKGRRAFLHSLIAPVIDEEAGDAKTDTLSGFLAKTAPPEDHALYACVPNIDPLRCNGCDACVNICPEAALILVKDEDAILQYAFQAHLCSGCGICVDVCEVSAMLLAKMARQKTSGLPLRRFSCRSCGSGFHLPDTRLRAEPTTGIGKADLCRICSRTNHNRKLFQVLT